MCSVPSWMASSAAPRTSWDHAAGALIEVVREFDEGVLDVVAQAQSGFQCGDQRAPGVALFDGAVGERVGVDQGEPAGDLAAADACEQADGVQFDSGVGERGRESFGEVLELVGDLGAGAGGQVEVVDLVDFTDR
jgi:hypothetical protein